MIYVYRRPGSDGAKLLADALGGKRIKRIPGRVLSADVLVCWGESNPNAGFGKVLNGAPLRNKYTDAVKLKEAGVPTIEVSRTQPPRQEPARLELQAGRYTRSEVEVIAREIATYLQQTARNTAAEWLPRTNYHTGGRDLLNPGRADFYAKREEIVEEYRIHSFLGKSIRAGIKKPRRSFDGTVHPWIRSYDSGWAITYSGFSSTPEMRKLAKDATKALGLDFAGVDLGRTSDGRLIVLEVNRAPGIEGNTVTAYAEAIKNWIGA